MKKCTSRSVRRGGRCLRPAVKGGRCRLHVGRKPTPVERACSAAARELADYQAPLRHRSEQARNYPDYDSLSALVADTDTQIERLFRLTEDGEIFRTWSELMDTYGDLQDALSRGDAMSAARAIRVLGKLVVDTRTHLVAWIEAEKAVGLQTLVVRQRLRFVMLFFFTFNELDGFLNRLPKELSLALRGNKDVTLQMHQLLLRDMITRISALKKEILRL